MTNILSSMVFLHKTTLPASSKYSGDMNHRPRAPATTAACTRLKSPCTLWFTGGLWEMQSKNTPETNISNNATCAKSWATKNQIGAPIAVVLNLCNICYRGHGEKIIFACNLMENIHLFAQFFPPRLFLHFSIASAFCHIRVTVIVSVRLVNSIHINFGFFWGLQYIKPRAS